MCPLVQFDGGGDLDHLQERDRALLHAGATRTRRREQRQPLDRRPVAPPTVIRSAAATPIEPARKSNSHGHHGDAPAEHRALAGQHRLVEPGLGRRVDPAAAPIALVGVDVQRWAVPAAKRPRVQHGVAQLEGTDPAHRASGYIGWRHDWCDPRRRT